MKSAEVLVKFKGDNKDLDKKTNEADSKLKAFAKGAGKALGVGLASAASIAAAAVGTVIAKVVELTKASVNAYSEFEQLEGGLISLFGEGSAEMQKILKQSEEAYKNLTMSQNEYLNNFQSSYPLVNAGLNENADAIEYTNKMLQLSSDLFNTYGGSIDYYQNAINWALKGSFVYLDNLNLGIKGTQEGFIEAANNAGILGREITNVNELTSDEIIDVIQHYAEAYGVWGKTAQEASSTIIGSMNMVKATWDNFILGLSKKDADIDTLIQNVVDSVLTFVDNITPVIQRVLTSLANALPTIADKLGEMIPELVDSLLPPIIKASLNLVKSLTAALPQIIKTLAKGVVDVVDGLLKLLPDIIDALIVATVAIIEALADAMPELLPTLIDAIIYGILAIVDNVPLIIKAAIQLLMGIVEAIPDIIIALTNALPDIIISITNALIEGIPMLIEGAIQLFMAILEAIPYICYILVEQAPQIITTLIDSLAKMNDKLKDAGMTILTNVIDGIKSIFSRMWEIGKDLIMGMWNGINDHISWIVNKIKGFGNSVLNAIRGIFGTHSPSTEFEWIGKMNMLGLEQGMESMKDKVQSTIDSAFNLQPNINGNMSSTYSPQMNVVVQNNMELDPLGQVVNQIKTFSGGAKNDYNWGAGL